MNSKHSSHDLAPSLLTGLTRCTASLAFLQKVTQYAECIDMISLHVLTETSTKTAIVDYRMAQPTQWGPAILDYMKKVKSTISTLSELEFGANTTVDM